MKFEIAIALDRGITRTGKNQDHAGYGRCSWFRLNCAKVALADGMGGYLGGEVASRLVVQQILTYFRKHQFNDANYESHLNQAVTQAHQAIKIEAGEKKELAAMGSTLSAAVFTQHAAYCINVGDSRIYHKRGEGFMQLSEDQSVVADLVRAGELKPEQVNTHPKRNRLTMSISAKRDVIKPMLFRVDIQAEDQFVFCSDGVWTVIPTELIIQTLNIKPVHHAAKIMTKLVNQYGGPDNISVIIVNIKR